MEKHLTDVKIKTKSGKNKTKKASIAVVDFYNSSNNSHVFKKKKNSQTGGIL